MLVFGAHQQIAEAAPIGLLAVAMAATMGAMLGLGAGMVRYRAAALVSVVGICASPIGLWLAHRVDNSWLTILFAGVLLIVAIRIFHRQGSMAAMKGAGSHPHHAYKIRRPVALAGPGRALVRLLHQERSPDCCQDCSA